jgi:hypothetical protein
MTSKMVPLLCAGAFSGLVGLGCATQARAENAVSCFGFNLQVSTTTAPFDAARITLQCGSVAPVLTPPSAFLPNVTFFAFRISDNPAVAQLLINALQYVEKPPGNGHPRSVIVTYNPSDLSANACGCGAANCRIILDISVGPQVDSG